MMWSALQCSLSLESSQSGHTRPSTPSWHSGTPSLHHSPPQGPPFVCPPTSGKACPLGAVAAAFLRNYVREFLDLPALTCTVLHRVMHRASGTAVIAAGCLMWVLVASWASTPTYHHNYGSGSTSQRLVVAAGLLLLLLLLVATAALSGRPSIRLAIPPCHGGK
jgi:hypothetical protein